MAPPPPVCTPAPEPPPGYFAVAPLIEPHPRGRSRLHAAVAVAVGVFVLAAAAVLAFTLWGGKEPENALSAQVNPPPAVPTSAANGQLPSTTTVLTTPSDVRLTSGAVPPGYHPVSGPGGITTCIPDGWAPKAGAVASNQQADNPARPSDFVRYGGSESPNTSLLNSILAGERTNPNVRNGYQRLRLEQVNSAASADTVDWEFTFVKDGRTRHAYGRYWRVNGIDYVVYASASPETWPAIQDVLTVMMRTATPV